MLHVWRVSFGSVRARVYVKLDQTDIPIHPPTMVKKRCRPRQPIS